MITGVNHITLSVRDLEESFNFYTQVLGLHPVVKWPKGACLSAGEMWMALILDEHTRPGPLAEYSHVAFTVSPQDFPKMSNKIRRYGAKIWQDNHSEGDSIYFVDPNGHKLEIHASDLENRIKTAKESPWGDAEFFV